MRILDKIKNWWDRTYIKQLVKHNTLLKEHRDLLKDSVKQAKEINYLTQDINFLLQCIKTNCKEDTHARVIKVIKQAEIDRKDPK